MDWPTYLLFLLKGRGSFFWGRFFFGRDLGVAQNMDCLPKLIIPRHDVHGSLSGDC